MDKVKIEVVSGRNGISLYINEIRLRGEKPFGGGEVLHTFEVSIQEIINTIEGKRNDGM